MLDFFGEYKILNTIGMGTNGVIYLVVDPETGTKAALKLLEFRDAPKYASKYDRTEDEYLDLAVRAYHKEYNLLSRMNHPGIPQCYHFEHTDSYIYLLEEYVQGMDLDKTILQQQLPARKAVQWGIRVLDALEYLHTRSRPVIHRDINPSNLLVNERGKVSIVDFGVAETTGKDRPLVGTRGYAPPEQYEGIARPESDIYALGATLHYLLTGADPRKAAMFSFDERPIRSLNPRVPEALARVVDRALAREMGYRYATAGEMRDALENSARG
jgi:serine/threonine protein kinase